MSTYSLIPYFILFYTPSFKSDNYQGCYYTKYGMLGLSKAANYSILVISYFVSQPGSEVKTNAELAEILDLPVDFLSKILQKLTHSGIIRSIKGINGGYTLAVNPASITLKNIIDSVDGPTRIVDNLKGFGESEHAELLLNTMAKFESTLNKLLERVKFQ